MKSLIKIFVVAFGALFFSLSAAAFDHSHKALDDLLKKHVVLVDGGKASKVNYISFMKDQAALKTYLDSLSAVPGGEMQGWGQAPHMGIPIKTSTSVTPVTTSSSTPATSR